MPYFITRASTEETRDKEVTGYVTEGEVCASVENPAAKNGDDDNLEGGCFWLNSARVIVDPDRDEVTLTCSIDDPRGAIAFTVRRIQSGPDAGQIVIHVPHPGESFAHVKTKQLHEGTLVLVDEIGNPRIFEDPAEAREREERHEAIYDAFDALLDEVRDTTTDEDTPKKVRTRLKPLLETLQGFDRKLILNGDESPLEPLFAALCEAVAGTDITFEGYQNDLVDAIQIED